MQMISMEKLNSIIMLFLVILLFFLVQPVLVQAANNYTVTVNSDGKMTDNGQMIFDERDVAPGFIGKYSVKFINKYNKDIHVYVDKISVSTTAPTTKDFRFAFGNGDLRLERKVNDFTKNSPSVVTVPANSSSMLDVELELLSSAGNEYQSTEFLFDIAFRVGTDIPDVGGGSVSTGDSIHLWLLLGLMLSSALCLFLLLLRQKKVEELENEQKSH